MTTDPGSSVQTPRLRFLTALHGWFRVWLVSILAALALTLAGVFPTLVSVLAMLGVIWMPIVVLTLWGRLLDEIMHPRSDLEDGCR